MEDFRGVMQEEFTWQCTRNFKCTDLVVGKAQEAGLLSPHPGLTSKPQSKLKVFSVTRKRAEAVQ